MSIRRRQSESNGDGLSYDGCALKMGGGIRNQVGESAKKRQKNAERQCRLRWRLTE